MELGDLSAGTARTTRSSRPTAPAACEACRKMKMRCIRTETDTPRGRIPAPCERCTRTNRTCRIPEPRPLGRKKGARGRYQGFDKAVRKLRSELRKAKMEPEAERLEEMVHIPSESSEPSRPNGSLPDEQAAYTISSSHIYTAPELRNASISEAISRQDIPPAAINHDASLYHPNSEPISNPLALLADASDAARALEPQTTSANTIADHNVEASAEGETHAGGLGRLLRRPGYVSLGLQLSRESLESALDTLMIPTQKTDRYSNYFKRPNLGLLLDVGPDVDPIDLGLITVEEAHHLFPIYFTRLHPINGILDPILHTPEFVRSRSALLFTWVLALTAQFDHGCASIAKRLRLHGEKLSRHVHTCGFKSVEIVQGYYISLLSATPADTLAEERSWLYTMYAFGVAAELGLDQYFQSNQAHDSLFPSNQGHQSLQTTDSRSGETLNRRDSSYEQRLIRNRERTWFRILLWERANSAAYGRIHSFPETALTQNIEQWWMHPLADFTDRHTSAFIALRRILAILNNDLRERAETTGSALHWVRDFVDATLQPWCDTWLEQSNTDTVTSWSAKQLSNIFLRYVYLHGRLWTLSIALYNSRERNSSDFGLRNDCFEAAVNACEVAVRDLEDIGEPLYCMLAPTWAMISYAAVLALKLFPAIYGPSISIQIELFALLSRVALNLERAGKTPSHRYGIAALLGQHIMMILRAKSSGLRLELEVHSSFTQNYGSSHQINSLEDGNRSSDPLISDYDPFLGDVNLPDISEEGFADLFREIFGPGFGNVF
ncbi:transcriptional regulator family: Fungal Specific TF [Penicillium herquei]|nr:transcriptional regulator family: Fungal Specific TF [Penicillium herquei]